MVYVSSMEYDESWMEHDSWMGSCGDFFSLSFCIGKMDDGICLVCTCVL